MKIILKFGTSTLIDEKGNPKMNIFEDIASTVNRLKEDHEVTIVASGAAMIGSKKLGFQHRPKKIEELQKQVEELKANLARAKEDHQYDKMVHEKELESLIKK